MSKKTEAGGVRPPSRATSRAARHHNASAQREAPAVPAAMREGAVGSSSAAMAALPRRAPSEYVTFQEAGTNEASVHHPGGPGHGGSAEAFTEPPTDRPYYIPAWQRRRERPAEEPRQRVPAERRTTMRPVGAPPNGPRPAGNGGYRTTTKVVERVSTIKPDDGGAADQAAPLAPPPGHHGRPDERRSKTMRPLEAPTGRPDDISAYYIPAWQRRRERTTMRPVGAPPNGPRPAGNGGYRTTTKVVERVSTIRPDDGLEDDHQATPLAPWTPTRQSEGKSPIIFSPDRRKRRKRPAAFCFTLCCILFWLAVILVGAAVLTVYLLYRPEPPRLRLTDASLNAGYINELTVPGGPPRGLALNTNLTVLAAVTSPNTKIDVVLWYMQLDLYFEGHMIGTQSLRPAPVKEAPGGYVLRSVDIVVSEVPISRQDAYAWRNATTHGGPVVLQLAGRFHTQLNFGRWLPYKYWVSTRCTLWLDPPPNGRLRRARC